MVHESIVPEDHGPYFAGDALDINLEVRDERGANPFDLTDATIDFKVKENRGDDTTVLTKSSSNTGEVTIDNASEGLATIHVATGDTDSFATGTEKQTYYWYIQVTDSNGKRATILHGDWVVHNT